MQTLQEVWSYLRLFAPTDLPSLFSTIANIVSLAAVFATIWSIRSSRRELRMVKEAEDEMNFDRALRSDDLGTLGKYLDRTLGQVSLWSYQYSQDDAKKINSRIDALIEFTAKDETADNAEDAKEITIPKIPTERSQPIPTVVQKAYEELADGNTWNALAILRRDIEVRLRRTNNESAKHRPVAALLNADASVQRAGPAAVALLRTVYQTASRAIHGEDLSDEEARRTIELAQRAYQLMDWADR